MDPHELGLSIFAGIMVRMPQLCQLPVAVSYLLNSGLLCQRQHLRRKATAGTIKVYWYKKVFFFKLY